MGLRNVDGQLQGQRPADGASKSDYTKQFSFRGTALISDGAIEFERPAGVKDACQVSRLRLESGWAIINLGER